MEYFISLAIGVVVLISGIFIGNFLGGITKEELKYGKKWFKILIIVSGLGAVVSGIILNEVLFFSFIFIAIVTSRSLKIRKF